MFTFLQDRNLLVRTSGGIVQGRRALTFDGTPYLAYQGIPYAKPPVGDLRFKVCLKRKTYVLELLKLLTFIHR